MLKTEMRNEHTMHIDKMTSLEMVAAMARENYRAAQAVEEQSEAIAKAIDIIAEAFNSGHRLFFMGCGTSGRLGVLDATDWEIRAAVELYRSQGSESLDLQWYPEDKREKELPGQLLSDRRKTPVLLQARQGLSVY